MKYDLIFQALSIRHALEVYLEIWQGCKVEEYRSFEDILKEVKIKKSAGRRITNRLSRLDLIASLKDPNSKDKRKRIYIIKNAYIANTLENLLKA